MILKEHVETNCEKIIEKTSTSSKDIAFLISNFLKIVTKWLKFKIQISISFEQIEIFQLFLHISFCLNSFFHSRAFFFNWCVKFGTELESNARGMHDRMTISDQNSAVAGYLFLLIVSSIYCIYWCTPDLGFSWG